MAPWNFPFMLLMMPLVGAISAGNCVVLKPAHYSKNTSEIIKKIISESMPKDYISVFLGGRDVNTELLKYKYDYIFFTGGQFLGKIVMKAASENLTPVTLELGGKCPCIVDKDAKLELAARRIVWGKCINSGQTCVAPDYLLVHKDIKDKLLELMKKNITEFYGQNPEESVDFSRMITDKQFMRVKQLLKSGIVYTGGNTNADQRYIEPTILTEVSPDSPIMQEEIFGTILPVLEYEDIKQAISFVNSRPKPLAFYFFSGNKAIQKEVLNKIPFGGGCINDTILHVSNGNLPFGGVGESGMGRFHGKSSFICFSNRKAVLEKSTTINLKLRYPPYGKKLNLLKMILK
jgi:aldehyde dehydrogenase (NAD+)